MLAPDLEIDFACRARPSEAMIENFLQGHGFSSFNEERARRRHERGFFPLQIDGYDSARRMLDVIGLKQPPSFGGHVNYRLTLTSPPPTRHDATLEHAAVDLVHGELGCVVNSVRTFENDADSASMFDRVYAEEQSRISLGRR
jgi:hypothetical protein